MPFNAPGQDVRRASNRCQRARMAMLALAVTLAAMALVPGAATAEHGSGIAAFEEATGDPCSLAAQNCKLVVHSTTETEYRAHTIGFEVVFGICDGELTGYLDADGSGHIVEQILTGEECAREPCETASEAEWDLHIDEVGRATEEAELRQCVQPIDEPTEAAHCSMPMLISIADHHNLELSTPDLPCHTSTYPMQETVGHWVSDTLESDGIELVHL